MNKKEMKSLTGTWVKVSDAILSIPSSPYSYLEADVHITSGATLIDMDIYTKKIQDDAVRKIANTFILNELPLFTASELFPELRASIPVPLCASTIFETYTGSEIISRLDRFEEEKKAKEDEKKRKEIEKAIELLRNEGYEVKR